MHWQQGFSKIKLLFWLALLGAIVWSSYMILPVYTTYWKVQDAISSIAKGMIGETETKIRRRLPEVFKIKYISHDDVPNEFYRNLVVEASPERVFIESEYSVTLWLIGPVQKVDPDEDYDEEELEGMDRLRAKGRIDFHFNPYAEFP